MTVRRKLVRCPAAQGVGLVRLTCLPRDLAVVYFSFSSALFSSITSFLR